MASKERELLELKKRKLEVTLAVTKKHIEDKERELQIQTANIQQANTQFSTLYPKVNTYIIYINL